MPGGQTGVRNGQMEDKREEATGRGQKQRRDRHKREITEDRQTTACGGKSSAPAAGQTRGGGEVLAGALPLPSTEVPPSLFITHT